MSLLSIFLYGCGSDIKVKAHEPSTEPSSEISSETSSEPSSETGSEPSSEASSEPSADPWTLLFHQANFAGTHNSYTGDSKGSITEQLDAGIRVLELDIHIDQLKDTGDYQIGHLWAGEGVALGNGNPNDVSLSLWLMQISTWSDNHVGHAPITIVLDAKDHIMGNLDPEDDSPFFLNTMLLDVFGSKLYTAEEYNNSDNGWPTVEELQDRIIVVLSGSEISRIRYNRDEGETPSISINDHGNVLHVHENGTGSIWYWFGNLQEDNTILWTNHGHFALGFNPSVDINNDGYFVVVYEGFLTGQIWYQSGQITSDGTVTQLQSSTEYDMGVLPSIRFLDRNTTTLHEIHSSAFTGQNWEWNGALNTTTGEISWTGNTETSQGRYTVDESFSSAGVVSTQSTVDGNSNNTLHYHSGLINERIRVPQIVFIEFQFANNDNILDDAHFFAGDATVASFISGWNAIGGVTRIWKFEPTIQATPNFAATDNPFSIEYQQWAEENSVFEMMP